MRAASLVLFAVAALAGWGTVPALGRERLLVPEMPGWKVVNSRADARTDVTELIPANESEESWTRRVTVHAYRGVAMDAYAFLDGLAARTAEVCDGTALEPMRPVALDGAVQAGRRGVSCGAYKGDGKGSYSLFYAIRGREALYVVARAWRGPPFRPGDMPLSASELAEWARGLDAVRLCDSDDSRRSCP